MERREKIEFYAKIYNTIQEMCRTARNNDIHLGVLENYLQNIDNHIWVWNIKGTSELYTKEERDLFIKLTDNIQDRIYFNI